MGYHPPSELNPPEPSSLHVELLGIWVVLHHLLQDRGLETHTNEGLESASLEDNIGLEVIENLVASEVTIAGKEEKFILLALSIQTQHHRPLHNHAQLSRLLLILDEDIA
jgi:hypothetical protein